VQAGRKEEEALSKVVETLLEEELEEVQEGTERWQISF